MERDIGIPGVELEAELGRGAFSVVYRGRRGEVPCAVKIGRSATATARWFRREAAALARVHDPGVPRVLDVGVAGGRPFLIMELVAGETLAARLERGPLPLADTLRLGRSLTRILGKVHARGLVHRDVKPRNIVLDPTGGARLVDFGLVSQRDPLPHTTEAAGTPSYAAPEQLRAPQLVDGRADLFALGRVLDACTGASRGGPLEPIIELLTREERRERYPEASAVLADLERVARGEPALGVDAAAASSDADALRIVARDGELRAARTAWEATRSGRGDVLLFEGPPGSGKSRLLDAIVRETGARLVLRCEGHGPLPLAALVDLFDRYLGVGAALPAAEASARAEALRAAVPAPAAPLLAAISPAVATALGRPEAAREREHDAFVEAAAAAVLALVKPEGGAVLLVDDLQWLDPVSREVLVRVGLGARAVGLLFVAAARSDSRALAPLARFVAALGGAFLSRPMPPLDRAGVEAITSEYLGDARPEASLVEYVALLADGTPLGALEVLGALLDGGALKPHWGSWQFDRDAAERGWLPRDVTALLERRVEQVPAATRRVLEAAAVLGGRFELERVGAILEVDPADLVFAVNEGAQAGLVELGRDRAPRFVHETVREAVLSGLSANARRALHQRAAEVLGSEDAGDRETLFELAGHLRRGEPERDPRRLYEVARAAAAQAAASLDFETALDLYEVVAVTAPAAGLELQSDHHVAVGEAALRVGALDASLRAFEAAARLARGRERAHVLGRIAWVHQVDGRPEQAWSLLEGAFAQLGSTLPTEAPVALVGSLGASLRARLSPGEADTMSAEERARVQELCDLHYQSARLGFEVGKPARALASTLAILAHGARLGVSPTLAKAYAAGAVISTAIRGNDGGYLERARAIGAELADPPTSAVIAQHAMMVACISGDFDGATRLCTEAVDDYGGWLEVGEIILSTLSLRLIEFVRGRPVRAWAWIERASSRTERQGRTAHAQSLMLAVSVRAARTILGRPDPTDVEELYRALETQSEPIRRPTWGPRAMALVEGPGDDAAFGRLEREFAKAGYNPRTANVAINEYYIALGHHRAQKALAAKGPDRIAAVRELDAALSDLAKAAKLPAFRAHLLLLEGYRALAVDDARRAWARFEAADALGRSETAPWVRAGAAHGRALLLLREGREEAAQDEGRVAVALSLEHGAIHRARRYAEELGLDADEQSTSSLLGEPRTMASSGRAPLRALVQVARAAGRGTSGEQQAKSVLDEVVRALGAERGALLFGRTGMATPCLVGRTAEGLDVPDLDLLREPLESLRDAGAKEQGAERAVRVVTSPLRLSEQVVGAIRLERAPGARAFGADDDELLAALSDQVALTLELAHVLEERERLQDSLRQAQKMEAVGQLASGIAHDFNNMLMAIVSSIDGIAEAPSLDELERADVETIREASRRAADLTQQLLAFSRRQVLAMGVIDLNEVASGLAPMLRRLIGPQIELRVLRDATPTWVSTDRSSLEQAIVNLAVNGRDAMSDGGVLTIEIGVVSLDETWRERGASEVGPHACLRVTDSGSGIPPEIRKRVFEPFFTTKPVGSGAGLGLASVYGFVKQTGGHVELQSELGVGTSFLLYFPISTAPAPKESTPPSAAETRPIEGASILLAEDEMLVRKSLTRILERAGFQVLAAEHGVEALDIARRAEQLDLVVTDVLMPGMSGPELARRLRDTGVTTPVLFISGFTHGELGERGVLNPGVEFLQKPCSANGLVDRVRELLRRAAAQPS